MLTFLSLISTEYLISIGIFTGVFILPGAVTVHKDANTAKMIEVKYFGDRGEIESLCVDSEETIFYDVFGYIKKVKTTRVIYKGKVVYKGGTMVFRAKNKINSKNVDVLSITETK